MDIATNKPDYVSHLAGRAIKTSCGHQLIKCERICTVDY